MLVDIPLDLKNFNNTLFNYIPCYNRYVEADDQKNFLYNSYVLGIMSLKEIEDNEELYMNFYDFYNLSKEK